MLVKNPRVLCMFTKHEYGKKTIAIKSASYGFEIAIYIQYSVVIRTKKDLGKQKYSFNQLHSQKLDL